MARQSNVPDTTKVPEIRTGDTVVVLSGKDAGKRGKVDRVIRNPVTVAKANRVWRRVSSRPLSVVVAGLNNAKRHTKPRQRASQNSQMPQVQQGGILDRPMPIDVSNVMIVCPHCEKVTRVKHETLANGKRVRVCRHCNEQLEASR